MIWKSRWGGYYSGQFREPEDVQLVRIPAVGEVKETLDLLDPHNDVNRHQIEIVLMTLKQMTPDGTDKKAWAEIHNAG